MMIHENEMQTRTKPGKIGRTSTYDGGIEYHEHNLVQLSSIKLGVQIPAGLEVLKCLPDIVTIRLEIRSKFKIQENDDLCHSNFQIYQRLKF